MTINTCSVTFCHKRPQRLNRKSDTLARIPKTTKPDIDNLWPSSHAQEV